MSKKSINDIRVPTYDDLFTNEEQRQEAKLEKIMEIPVEMKKREHGESSIKLMHSFYYMIKVTLAILIERLR